MEMRGRVAAREGGSAAIGSSRYSFTTSSLIGADAQKYPNVLLRGMTSPRNRSANWPTVTLEGLDGARLTGTGSLWLDIYFSTSILAKQAPPPGSRLATTRRARKVGLGK